MKRIFIVKRINDRNYGVKYPGIITGILCLFILLPILLSGCDVMGGSIDDFINTNTGDVWVNSWAFAPGVSHSRVNEIWQHGTTKDGFIDVNFFIGNPQNYGVKFIVEVIGFNGKDGVWKKSAPSNIPVKLISTDNDIVKLRIGDSANILDQGDSFKIRLIMEKDDGTRDFGYFDLPQIVYDSQLYPAFNLRIDTETNADQPYATWEIQTDDAHKGITNTTLLFKSRDSDFQKGSWIYLFDKDTESWILTNDDSADANYRYIEMDPDDTNSRKFRLPFPLKDTVDMEYFADNYDFFVTLVDKNGVTAQSSLHGINDLLWMDNIRIEHQIRTPTGYIYQDDPFFTYKDGVAVYYLVVPYLVDGIRITTSKKYPENQKVSVAPNTTEESGPVTRGLPTFGVNNVQLKVDWVEIGSTVSDAHGIYTFTIYRNPPDRDSALRMLKVKDSVKSYELSPDFIVPSLNVAEQFNIEKNYTVYVPNSVSSVTLEWDYFSTSSVKSKRANQAAWDTTNYLAPVIEDTLNDISYLGAHHDIPASPSVFMRDAFYHGDWFYNTTNKFRYNYNGDSGEWINTYFNYSEYAVYFPDYGGINSIDILRSGRSYSISEGENNFEIMVQPQSGDSRIYNVKVVKAVTNGNIHARLDNLVNTTAGEFTPVFESGLFSYTVNVPNGTGNVTLQALEATDARIIEISSSTSSQPGWTYDETAKTATTIISGITAGSTRLITFKVSGGPVGSTPNNYTVRVNGNLPSLASPPILTGGNGTLEVSWTAGGASYFDVCFAEGEGSTANQATLWQSGISSSSTIITALTNNDRYNVWVRQRNLSGIVGEWTRARTSTSPLIEYGTPGIAQITGITTETGSLSPSFNPATRNYTLDLPADTSLVEATIDRAIGNTVRLNGTILSSEEANFNFPAAAGGANITNTIIAASPDGKATATYTVIARRMLSAPENLSLTPGSQRIDVSWNTVPNAASYEIFYTPQNPAGQTTIMEIASASTSVTITGLINNRDYKITVRAKKSDGLLGEEVTDFAKPEDSNFTIKIELNGGLPEEYDFSALDDLKDIVLSWSGNNEASLLVLNSLSPVWHINDKLITGITEGVNNKLVVKARDYSIAVHYISLRISSGGREYSTTIKFTVEP